MLVFEHEQLYCFILNTITYINHCHLVGMLRLPGTMGLWWPVLKISRKDSFFFNTHIETDCNVIALPAGVLFPLVISGLRKKLN